MGYLTPKPMAKIEQPQCECWTPAKRWQPESRRCPFAARFELEDGTKVCGTHAKHPTPTHAWEPEPDRVQKAADLRAARRVLADFKKNGGTTLKDLKKKLGL